MQLLPIIQNQKISWVLPALTTDYFELTCLLNVHRSFGSDLGVYKRIYAYYMNFKKIDINAAKNFKKIDINAAKNFLEGIYTSVTLAELSLRL